MAGLRQTASVYISTCVSPKMKFESRCTLRFSARCHLKRYTHASWNGIPNSSFFHFLEIELHAGSEFANVKLIDRCLCIIFRIFSVLTVLGNLHVCRWINCFILVETMTEISCHWANTLYDDILIWYHFISEMSFLLMPFYYYFPGLSRGWDERSLFIVFISKLIESTFRGIFFFVERTFTLNVAIHKICKY